MKTFLGILTIILTIISISVSAQNNYSFFIAGHASGQPGINNIGLHPPFVEKFSYIKSREEIKFGVLTGDIAGSIPNANDWDEVDADIDTLGLPVYMAVGNHDMRDRELWESRYGSTYYHFLFENDLFIILDPNIDGWSITGDQLQFMYDVVNENSAYVDNIFVFFHQLLWWENSNIYGNIDPNSNEGINRPLNFYTEIEPFFHELNNKVIMCAGDLGATAWSGDFLYDSYDNISFVASGMGKGVEDNFIIINVDDNKEVTYDLICLNDTTLECFGELTDYMISGIYNNYVMQSLFYPQPAKSQVRIQNTVNSAIIEIYSINGQLIKQITYEQGETINVSDINNGIYICKLTSSDIITISKLTIYR